MHIAKQYYQSVFSLKYVFICLETKCDWCIKSETIKKETREERYDTIKKKEKRIKPNHQG